MSRPQDHSEDGRIVNEKFQLHHRESNPPRATWKQVGEHKGETQSSSLPKLVSQYSSAGKVAGCRIDNRRLIPDRGRHFSFSIMLRLKPGVTHQTCYQMSTKIKLQQHEAGQLPPNTKALLLPVLVFHDVL